MPRKQIGMVDDGLLDRVDARARELGQTRRVFVERALVLALDEPDQRPMRGCAPPSTTREQAPDVAARQRRLNEAKAKGGKR